jgi:Flp pilus assembly protein TadG
MHRGSSLSSVRKRRGVLLRLLHDVSGANAIEFAFAAIPLFLFLLGVIDFARLYWTQSALQYAAEAAARCATLNCCAGGPATCDNGTGTTGLQAFAANQLLGLSIASSDLSNFSLNSQACGNQVSFNYTYNFIIGQLISNTGITLQGSACTQG